MWVFFYNRAVKRLHTWHVQNLLSLSSSEIDFTEKRLFFSEIDFTEKRLNFQSSSIVVDAKITQNYPLSTSYHPTGEIWPETSPATLLKLHPECVDQRLVTTIVLAHPTKNMYNTFYFNPHRESRPISS